MFSTKMFDERDTHIHWFRKWNSELTSALMMLPESECCPHELYKLLCENKDSSKKRFAIITDEKREPIAVVCLRKRKFLNDWVPLTHYTIPGMIFPVRDGCLGRALSVLNKDIWFAWWRMSEFCENIDNIVHNEVKPTYEINLTGDYEKYWKKNSHLTEIRKQRNRCKDFEITICGDGMTEWVINNWEMKWRDNPSFQRPDLEDKIIAAKYLQGLGKNFTFTLLDKKKPIGGHTFLAHSNTLVWQYTYREPQYNQFGIGTYLMDSAIKWAVESGFTAIDLGGDHPEHKKRWGPVKGSKTSLHLCPKHLVLMNRAKEVLSYVREKGIRQAAVTAIARTMALLHMFI